MDLEIIDIASDTNNNKDIANHTHISKLKNSLCGDEIQIKLIIKDDKIMDFGYLGKSCIYCQASASLLSKIAINQKKNKIEKLCDEVKTYFENNANNIEFKWMSLKKLFKKENLSRKECILLPFKTLKRIVTN
tara:strand:- start:4100 stop:4498 length:399 start_codon:yes stop_codon:yes gene_type:complete